MFTQTLIQVANLFLFLVVGYVLTKKSILPKDSPKVLSPLLVWVACPALYLKTFATQFTPDNLPSYIKTILVSLVCLGTAYGLSIILGRLTTKDKYARSVITYSLCVPNSGYMGNALALALLGESFLLRYQVFCLPVTVFMVTVGYSLLLERKLNLKSFFNPMIAGMLIGIILGLLRVTLPKLLTTMLTGASNCLGPLSMILTGCVIAQFKLSDILSGKEIYITIGVKMILMPLMLIALSKLVDIPKEFFMIMLMFECLPVGLNSVVYPSTIGKDCSFGAGLAVVSNVLAVITIPLFLAAAM